MPDSGPETRLGDVHRFYALMENLEERTGGKRVLATADGRVGWPERGVYFYFEPGEVRRTSGTGDRVVRVGTHALRERAGTTLWGRLSTHKGPLAGMYPNGGNHRASIFRGHVGSALIARDSWPPAVCGNWCQGSQAPASVRRAEHPLEKAVSIHIREMPFLVLAVEDPPGPVSARACIEANSIALLSNYGKLERIDTSSELWLGRHSPRPEIQESGLWNVRHVDATYDPGFLDVLQSHIASTCRIGTH